MLIACNKTFKDSDAINTPWTARLFKGSQGLCWNVILAPSHTILMGLYSCLQFLPSHMLLTFEEVFYIEFFEHAKMSGIFIPLDTEYATRHVAFQDAKDQNPLDLTIVYSEQL